MSKNVFIEPKSAKAVMYAAAWALLAKWDESIGGPVPTIDNIDTAIALMSKPGGKPAVLNQGLRANVLGYRPDGSTDGQRAYASMANAPHNNVGKLGDALRSQHKTSRLDVGKPVNVTLPGGIVTVSSNKAGHVHFEVVETFAKPDTTTPTTAPAKAKGGKGKARKVKAAKANVSVIEVPQAPTPDMLSEGDALAMQDQTPASLVGADDDNTDQLHV